MTYDATGDGPPTIIIRNGKKKQRTLEVRRVHMVRGVVRKDTRRKENKKSVTTTSFIDIDIDIKSYKFH